METKVGGKGGTPVPPRGSRGDGSPPSLKRKDPPAEEKDDGASVQPAAKKPFSLLDFLERKDRGEIKDTVNTTKVMGFTLEMDNREHAKIAEILKDQTKYRIISCCEDYEWLSGHSARILVRLKDGTQYVCNSGIGLLTSHIRLVNSSRKYVDVEEPEHNDAKGRKELFSKLAATMPDYDTECKDDVVCMDVRIHQLCQDVRFFPRESYRPPRFGDPPEKEVAMAIAYEIEPEADWVLQKHGPISPSVVRYKVLNSSEGERTYFGWECPLERLMSKNVTCDQFKASNHMYLGWIQQLLRLKLKIDDDEMPQVPKPEPKPVVAETKRWTPHHWSGTPSSSVKEDDSYAKAVRARESSLIDKRIKTIENIMQGVIEGGVLIKFAWAK